MDRPELLNIVPGAQIEYQSSDPLRPTEHMLPDSYEPRFFEHSSGMGSFAVRESADTIASFDVSVSGEDFSAHVEEARLSQRSDRSDGSGSRFFLTDRPDLVRNTDEPVHQKSPGVSPRFVEVVPASVSNQNPSPRIMPPLTLPMPTYSEGLGSRGDFNDSPRSDVSGRSTQSRRSVHSTTEALRQSPRLQTSQPSSPSSASRAAAVEQAYTAPRRVISVVRETQAPSRAFTQPLDPVPQRVTEYVDDFGGRSFAQQQTGSAHSTPRSTAHSSRRSSPRSAAVATEVVTAPAAFQPTAVERERSESRLSNRSFASDQQQPVLELSQQPLSGFEPAAPSPRDAPQPPLLNFTRPLGEALPSLPPPLPTVEQPAFQQRFSEIGIQKSSHSPSPYVSPALSQRSASDRAAQYQAQQQQQTALPTAQTTSYQQPAPTMPAQDPAWSSFSRYAATAHVNVYEQPDLRWALPHQPSPPPAREQPVGLSLPVEAQSVGQVHASDLGDGPSSEEFEKMSTELDAYGSMLRKGVMNAMHSLRAKMQREYTAVVERERQEFARQFEDQARVLDQHAEQIRSLEARGRRQKTIRDRLAFVLGRKTNDTNDSRRVAVCFSALKAYAQRRKAKEQLVHMCHAHHRKAVLRQIVSAWRRFAQVSRRDNEVAIVSNKGQAVLLKMKGEYEQQIAELRRELDVHKERLRVEEDNKAMLEANLRKAFMRGVCALNMEAMSILKEGHLPPGPGSLPATSAPLAQAPLLSATDSWSQQVETFSSSVQPGAQSLSSLLGQAPMPVYQPANTQEPLPSSSQRLPTPAEPPKAVPHRSTTPQQTRPPTQPAVTATKTYSPAPTATLSAVGVAKPQVKISEGRSYTVQVHRAPTSGI